VRTPGVASCVSEEGANAFLRSSSRAVGSAALPPPRVRQKEDGG